MIHSVINLYLSAVRRGIELSDSGPHNLGWKEGKAFWLDFEHGVSRTSKWRSQLNEQVRRFIGAAAWTLVGKCSHESWRPIAAVMREHVVERWFMKLDDDDILTNYDASEALGEIGETFSSYGAWITTIS